MKIKIQYFYEEKFKIWYSIYINDYITTTYGKINGIFEFELHLFWHSFILFSHPRFHFSQKHSQPTFLICYPLFMFHVFLFKYSIHYVIYYIYFLCHIYAFTFTRKVYSNNLFFLNFKGINIVEVIGLVLDMWFNGGTCSIPPFRLASSPIQYDKVRHTSSSCVLLPPVTINARYNKIYLQYIFYNFLVQILISYHSSYVLVTVLYTVLSIMYLHHCFVCLSGNHIFHYF